MSLVSCEPPHTPLLIRNPWFPHHNVIKGGHTASLSSQPFAVHSSLHPLVTPASQERWILGLPGSPSKALGAITHSNPLEAFAAALCCESFRSRSTWVGLYTAGHPFQGKGVSRSSLHAVHRLRGVRNKLLCCTGHSLLVGASTCLPRPA